MVTGWRRAFCTSIPKKQESPGFPEKQLHHQQQQQQSNSTKSPRFSSKFGFFSNPSTPRLQSQPVSSPRLRCRTTCTPTSSVPNSPKLHCRTSHFSDPSSHKSPSSFSFLKSTICLSKAGRCGICLESVKTGQGTAIFTAECSHSFHFHCVAAHIRKQHILICPVCSTSWKDLPLLSLQHSGQPHKTSFNSIKTKPLRVYNDGEPLVSPVSLSQFNPIPESEETENDDEEEEFQGFFVTPMSNARDVEVRLSQEAAMVAAGRSYESYVVVMKVSAPTLTHGLKRAAIDLVMVLDISGSAVRLQMVKRAMRSIISLLNEKDRLSIIIFSSSSKRLLPLTRMSSSGRRSVRRIVDALGNNGQGMSVNDALKKAVKVLEDRREKNSVASIMILSDCNDKQSESNPTNENLPVVFTTRLSHSEIPVHSFHFGSCTHAPNEDTFCKIVNGLLSVVVQDVRLQLGFESRSAPAEISSVYSLTARPALMGSSSVRVGDLHSGEERELLVELKVPVSSRGFQRMMSLRSSYRDPFSQEMVYSRYQSLVLPRLPQSFRSSSHSAARLRNLHVSTRTVVESRGLIESNDLTGAQHLLTSARALLMQSSSSSGEEFIRGLESELSEMNRRRLKQRVNNNNNNGRVEEKVEPLTPTSAWRAAERLAKLAIMRKHMNRVSDLHGFENARF
ncbi:protein RMD5-like protein A-like isoform X1 [Hibiscus syriacus]|uniref:Protein RMD5-like protein A-like isoform X1 n=1 Tax=Hibiscus syriacus TaxID=106335 RepID=A0A6A2ZMZ2_HIBSY|nr:probable E3 ubiquitin-protein ligase EDA40 [Hibiscus syriacus]KAE8693391.1 protein RMD5-like protein A-like isoform X1 [Hibiscus syriacus]